MTDLADRLVIKDGNVFAVDPPRRGLERRRRRVDGRLPARQPPRAAHRRRAAAARRRRRRRRPHAPSTATPAARGSSAASTPTARWSSASWRPARSSWRREADFVTIFGLRGIVPRRPARRAPHRAAPPRGAGRAARGVPLLPRARGARAGGLRGAARRVRRRALRHRPAARLRRPADAALVARRRAVLRGGRARGTPRCSAATASSRRCRSWRSRPTSPAGTLRLLAAHIGREDDPERAEEPGKILHELRPGRERHAAGALLRQRRRDAAVPARAGGDGRRRAAGASCGPRPTRRAHGSPAATRSPTPRARCATRAGRTPRTACRPRIPWR